MSIRAQKGHIWGAECSPMEGLNSVMYGKFDGTGPCGAVYWQFSGGNGCAVQCGNIVGGGAAGRV